MRIADQVQRIQRSAGRGEGRRSNNPTTPTASAVCGVRVAVSRCAGTRVCGGFPAGTSWAPRRVRLSGRADGGPPSRSCR